MHWGQVAEAFRGIDCRCEHFDYHAADRRGIVRKLERKFFDVDVEAQLRARRTAALLDAAKRSKSQTLLIHHLRFDMSALRDAFPGKILYWDVDGPAGDLSEGRLPEGVEVDRIFTVSRLTRRTLEKTGSTPIHYLPNGVSTEFYRPARPGAPEVGRFCSALAFLGRPTPRRIEMLAALAKKDLVLWGRRWTKACSQYRDLARCVREEGDLLGEEVAALYRNANMIVDIAREPLVAPATVLGLPAFQVPASGGCLLTEWVEELEEAFEPGVEVLTFRSIDELLELVDRYAGDPETRSRIGSAGRKRCVAEHSLLARAEVIKRFI